MLNNLLPEALKVDKDAVIDQTKLVHQVLWRFEEVVGSDNAEDVWSFDWFLLINNVDLKPTEQVAILKAPYGTWVGIKREEDNNENSKHSEVDQDSAGVCPDRP